MTIVVPFKYDRPVIPLLTTSGSRSIMAAALLILNM